MICGPQERNPMLNAKQTCYNNLGVANVRINIWTTQRGLGRLLLLLNGDNMVGSSEKLPLSQVQYAKRRKVL